MAKKHKKTPKKRKRPAKPPKEEKHAGGRPSKYKPKYCKEIIDFFSVEPTREVDVLTTFKNGTTRESTEERPNHIPFFADFAHKIGVTDATVVNWTKRHSGFLSAYTRAKALQKQHLITCGLLGHYNSKFAIFTAINITDMKDKTEHEIGGKDGKPIPVCIVDFGKINDST